MAEPRPISLAWLPVAIAAVAVPVLWFTLGVTEDGHPAMPAWAALLYHFGGRIAVVGVFAVAGYFWLCVALAEHHPNVATGLLLAGIVSGLATIGVTGGPVVSALAWFALAWIGSLLLPGPRVRRVASTLVWVAGTLGGAAAAALSGRWCVASAALLLLVFGGWVATSPRRPGKPG